jgi:hypothetical protein
MVVSDLCSGCFEIKFPSVSDVFTVIEAENVVKEMYHPKHCTMLLLGGMITVLI